MSNQLLVGDMVRGSLYRILTGSFGHVICIANDPAKDHVIVTPALDAPASKLDYFVVLKSDLCEELSLPEWLDVLQLIADDASSTKSRETPPDSTGYLIWRSVDKHKEAQLGTEEDGVFFSLSYYPTCYRRGPYRLLVTVCSGPNHHKWGCFDDADQPERWYHKESNAMDEAESIARVLLAGRHKTATEVNK